MKKKFLIQQLLILVPLSMSAVFLVGQFVSSRMGSGNNGTSQTVRTTPLPSERNTTPLSGANNAPLSDPGDPFGGGNPGGAPSAPGGAVPLDGGLSLLLVAGVGFGARKAYKYHTQQKKDNF
jgi:hypothetical protein